MFFLLYYISEKKYEKYEISYLCEECTDAICILDMEGNNDK